MARARSSKVAGFAIVLLLVVLAGVTGYVVTDAVRGTPKPATTPLTPSALVAAGHSPAPAGAVRSAAPARAAAVARALGPLLSAAGLGDRVRADVVDATTGATLLDRSATTPVAPASTAKLLTAAAVLTVRPASYRLTTTVRRGPGGALVLVGGGDPTLSGAAAGKPTAYPEAARVSALAAAIRRADVRPSRIVVDDSLFAGPAVSPTWGSGDVPTDYASAITPTMVDGGRDAPSDTIRSATPDLAAGHRLAAALGQPDLPVGLGRAPAGAPVVATVRSAPLSSLVAQMLQDSDNVIAECLARQVAIAQHGPASFAGAAAAVRQVLVRAGLDPGAGMTDGSGLAASDRVPSSALAATLRLAARSARLRWVLAGLPVAGWSGTLADRYLAGRSRPGAGNVRAKTGTLTGVSALAGLVRDRGGRLLVFAFVADHAPSTPAAEDALDALAARLATCTCT